MRIMALTALAAILMAGTAQADITVQPLEGRVPAGLIAANVHAGGRVAKFDPIELDSPYLHAWQYQWPGTYFETAFTGTDAYFRVEDSINILKVLVDDQPVATLTKPGIKDYHVSGLGQGDHTLRIERLTEDQTNTASFDGFDLPGGEIALPVAPSPRQIEFIGDSYTVGYGNTSSRRECTKDEVWATTDTSQAFGPLTAKHYNADYQINAISGHGIVRNYNGFIGDPVPVAYPYAFLDKKAEYTNPDWRPQIIVIGLGTNDFSTPLNPGEKWATRDALHTDYEATYVKFVQDLRARNPQAFFILMATDQADGEIQSEVNKVITQLNAAGETRVTFLPMNNLSFSGCDWHPSAADDKVVEGVLETYIDAHTELWQGK